jgi:ABC-type nickel/cobalt efflux system permease component RcnA
MVEYTFQHYQDLVATGITLGLVHVLAGPDHLTALAALSVGSSWRAFGLGFRWGIGHSSGLVIVACVFIYLKGEMNLAELGRYCDVFVGFFMIILGICGAYGAMRMYLQKREKRDPDLEMNSTKKHNKSSSELKVSGYSSSSNSSRLQRSPSSDSPDSDGDDGNMQSTLDTATNSASKRSDNISSHNDHEHHHDACSFCQWCFSSLPVVDLHDPHVQRLLSFGIGITHGVAGPGGILGVLPAVEMQNWRSSVVYLSSFIITSTLAMGAFAALYGEVTKRIGATAESVELGLGLFSAVLSILVGSVWLTLSVLGVSPDDFLIAH